MTRFANQHAKEAFETGLADGVPVHISRKAHWKLHLLLAAFGWEDIAVIGSAVRSRSRPGRFGLHLESKWYITFSWSDEFKALEIRLERW